MLRVVVLGAAAGGGFRNGIADVRFAGWRGPSIPNFKAPKPRSRSVPTAITGS